MPHFLIPQWIIFKKEEFGSNWIERKLLIECHVKERFEKKLLIVTHKRKILHV